MSEEEIRKAAVKYAYDAYGEEEPECVIESIADDFEAGVKWIMSKNSCVTAWMEKPIDPKFD